ncbi:MAG: hypothetical protein OXU64_09910 [Gemmatimonadota bacterium]|nr:hypothetical protein [Gemmatimonadota bacterium]
MSFPDLPEGYDRHKDALAIVDPGASNPAGVALAIHQACTQVIHEGGSQREDPAVRLMTTQLAFLVQGNSDLDPCEYGRLMDACRARAAERRDAPKPATTTPA